MLPHLGRFDASIARLHRSPTLASIHQPWVVQQRWDDLLFLHWEVSQTQMRQRIPKGLELDLYDGKAWIGIVPFEIKRITRRVYLPLPGCVRFQKSTFALMSPTGPNPGYGFQSHIPNPLAVWAAHFAISLLPVTRETLQAKGDSL